MYSYLLPSDLQSSSCTCNSTAYSFLPPETNCHLPFGLHIVLT